MPGSIRKICLKPAYLDMPEAGKAPKQSALCLSHQGSNHKFPNSAYPVSESHSGVVVLTNSVADKDSTDWLGEVNLKIHRHHSSKNKYMSQARGQRSSFTGFVVTDERRLVAKKDAKGEGEPAIGMSRGLPEHFQSLFHRHLLQDDKLMGSS
jgi:hypothetical protein